MTLSSLRSAKCSGVLPDRLPLCRFATFPPQCGGICPSGEQLLRESCHQVSHGGTRFTDGGCYQNGNSQMLNLCSLEKSRTEKKCRTKCTPYAKQKIRRKTVELQNFTVQRTGVQTVRHDFAKIRFFTDRGGQGLRCPEIRAPCGHRADRCCWSAQGSDGRHSG